MHRFAFTLAVLTAIAFPPPAVLGEEPGLHDVAEQMIGRVALHNTEEGDLVAAIDVAAADGPDGIFEHVFILQQEAPVYLSQILDDAEIMSRSRSLQILSRDGEVLYFLRLSGKPDALTARRLQSLTGETQVIEGYGLARHDGRYLLGPDPLAAPFERSRLLTTLDAADLRSESAAVFNQDWTPPGELGGGCRSGGAGSTSCSQTCGVGNACTISCEPGYYACCNCSGDGASCKCKRNP